MKGKGRFVNVCLLLHDGLYHFAIFLLTYFVRRLAVAYPGIFFGGGSTNSVEDRENGDLGAVAP